MSLPMCRAFALLCLLTALGSTPTGLQAAEAPDAVVRDTSERVLAFLRTEGQTLENDPGRVYRLVDEVVLPVFDFRRMSQWVLGRHWKSASPAQKDAFVTEFRDLLVRTYSTALFEYSNQEVEVSPAVLGNDGRSALVRSRLLGFGPDPIPVDYRLFRGADGWKVFDVSVSGVSLVSTYRGSFSEQIQRGGLDGLIEDLRERNAAVGAAA